MDYPNLFLRRNPYENRMTSMMMRHAFDNQELGAIVPGVDTERSGTASA